MKDNGAHGYTEGANYTTEEQYGTAEDEAKNTFTELGCGLLHNPKEVLQVESNGWIKILSEKDLPKTFQELILYREDAGVFVGYYGNLAESLSEIAVENHYNNEVSEETMWKEQFFYFGLEGNGILEGSEGPTHWMPLPEPPKF